MADELTRLKELAKSLVFLTGDAKNEYDISEAERVGDLGYAVKESVPLILSLITRIEGARNEALEEALRTVHEQRCERGTDWDRAVLACAAAVEALKTKPPAISD